MKPLLVPTILFITSSSNAFLPNLPPKHKTSLNNNISTTKNQFSFPSIFQTKKTETEEERLMRLKREELERLELNEQERTIQVQKDKFPYFVLFALQFLPLVGNDRILSVLYFWGVAVTTVYLGGRQITLEEERVSKQNALGAPIGASLSIGLLYVLIKNGVDIGALYAIGVSLFGALAISDVGVPILRNVFPENFATGKIKVSSENFATGKIKV